MAFTQFVPSDLQVFSRSNSCVKLRFQRMTLTLPKGRGEVCYLVVPLVPPRLETEPGPGVLAEVRSPLLATGGLEAAGRKPS